MLHVSLTCQNQHVKIIASAPHRKIKQSLRATASWNHSKQSKHSISGGLLSNSCHITKEVWKSHFRSGKYCKGIFAVKLKSSILDTTEMVISSTKQLISFTVASSSNAATFSRGMTFNPSTMMKPEWRLQELLKRSDCRASPHTGLWKWILTENASLTYSFSHGGFAQ